MSLSQDVVWSPLEGQVISCLCNSLEICLFCFLFSPNLMKRVLLAFDFPFIGMDLLLCSKYSPTF